LAEDEDIEEIKTEIYLSIDDEKSVDNTSKDSNIKKNKRGTSGIARNLNNETG